MNTACLQLNSETLPFRAFELLLPVMKENSLQVYLDAPNIGLVVFNGIPTLLGYLMPKHIYFLSE